MAKGRGETLAWTAEHDALLRELWEAGATTGEIGRRLQRSTNSVIGRAHRLSLPRPASPIIRAAGVPRPKPVRTDSAAALARAQKRSAAVAAPRPVTQIPARAGDPTAAVPQRTDREDVTSRGLASLLPALPPPVPRAPAAGFSGCRWPLWGDKERPDHRFCGEPARRRPDGSRCVYCAEHAARAFTRHIDRDPNHKVIRSTFAWGGVAA
jgi:GcrA cell cycle regulator